MLKEKEIPKIESNKSVHCNICKNETQARKCKPMFWMMDIEPAVEWHCLECNSHDNVENGL